MGRSVRGGGAIKGQAPSHLRQQEKDVQEAAKESAGSVRIARVGPERVAGGVDLFFFFGSSFITAEEK